MDDPLFVGCSQTFGQLRAKPHNLLLRQVLLTELVAERFPGDVLHRQEVHSCLCVEVIDGCDIGVVQLGESIGLLAEALTRGMVGEGTCRQDFDRDIASQVLIAGTIDFSHAASADLLGDTVVPQHFAGSKLLDHLGREPWPYVQSDPPLCWALLSGEPNVKLLPP